MPDKAIIEDGATQVGIAWLIKEIFAFLVKWTTARKEESHGDDDWKEFCKEQFNNIKDDVREIKRDQKSMEEKLQDFKMEHRKCLGKD